MTKQLSGTKEQFIKDISHEILSPIDKLLHNLEYSHYEVDTDRSNVYNQLDDLDVVITDSPELTKVYNNLKSALQEFEEATGVPMLVKPRGDNSGYNTIVDKRSS